MKNIHVSCCKESHILQCDLVYNIRTGRCVEDYLVNDQRRVRNKRKEKKDGRKGEWEEVGREETND